MGAEPEYAAPWQLVPGCGKQAGCQLVHVACNPQRIHRRLAAADLLADGFLQVDDRAGLVHGGKLALLFRSGERSFHHATSALVLRHTALIM